MAGSALPARFSAAISNIVKRTNMRKHVINKISCLPDRGLNMVIPTECMYTIAF